MPADIFSCPQCATLLRRSPQLPPNARVQCPKCSFQFSVPAAEADVAPPPQPDRAITPDGGNTPAAPGAIDRGPEADRDERVGREPRRAADRYDRDSDSDPRRPDEEEDEDYRQPSTARPIGSVEELPTDYQIDLRAWLSCAKEHWSAFAGPAIGFLLLHGLISLVVAVIPFAGGVIGIVVNPPLGAGLTIVCLAQLKGKPWTFGDFFSGFNKLGETIALTLLQGLAGLAAMIPGIIAFIIVLVAANGGMPPAAYLIAVPFGLLSIAALIYLQVRLSFFALPLLFDRNFGIIECLTGSWRLTKDHTMGLIGVSLLMGLINFGGALLCGVGALFTAPLTMLATTAGYLLIAGTRPPVSADHRDEGYDHDRDDRYRDEY